MPLRPGDYMGFAVIMFGSLLVACVVMVTAVTYGIEKESQVVPLEAVNDYAAREGRKAQTGLTIVNTCIDLSNEYNAPSIGGGASPGFHNLYLTVKNNGSIVLNSTKTTVLYNSSYINFLVTSQGTVWAPLTNASFAVSNIWLDPNIPSSGPELRLLVAAENGVSAIAPTTPTNFSVTLDSKSNTYSFSWKASRDDEGIDHYIIYKFDNSAPTTCPINPSYVQWVAGNQTNVTFTSLGITTTYIFMTAVDLGGNMAIHSRTFICTGSSGNCND